MAESMIVLERTGGYTVLPNGILRDAGLSLRTKGLFAVILSLPEGWDYSVAGLAAVAGCGKDAVRGALKEMEEAGYLTRRRSHGEGGKFDGMVYIIRDVAARPEPPTMEGEKPLSGNPTTVKPMTGKPSTENPTQLNKEQYSKDLSNTPPTPPEGGGAPERKPKRRRAGKSVPSWEPERFEGFWRAYPRDEDRAKAVEQWDRLPRDRELMERYGTEEALLHDIAVGLKRHLDCEDWREGRGIPYAFRWLRDRRWTEKRKTAGPSPEVRPSRVVESGEVPVW